MVGAGTEGYPMPQMPRSELRLKQDFPFSA